MSQKKILFGKKNYIILFLSLAIIVIGFFLMSGGGSEDPNIFNPEIFNFRRIKLAPTLVIFGFILAIFSILVKNKTSK
tara:strand:+ start:166 stop:399 length:234 start_codon:yes stop_codon:yes gene_type:complete